MPWADWEAEWQALSEEVYSGLADWRAAHPRATVAEIEGAGGERLAGLRGGFFWSGRPRGGGGRAAGGPAGALARAGRPGERRDQPAGAATVPDVWWGGTSAGNTHTAPDRVRRSSSGTGADLRRVPPVWHRSFSPWMRNWPWRPAVTRRLCTRVSCGWAPGCRSSECRRCSGTSRGCRSARRPRGG